MNRYPLLESLIHPLKFLSFKPLEHTDKKSSASFVLLDRESGRVYSGTVVFLIGNNYPSLQNLKAVDKEKEVPVDNETQQELSIFIMPYRKMMLAKINNAIDQSDDGQAPF